MSDNRIHRSLRSIKYKLPHDILFEHVLAAIPMFQKKTGGTWEPLHRCEGGLFCVKTIDFISTEGTKNIACDNQHTYEIRFEREYKSVGKKGTVYAEWPSSDFTFRPNSEKCVVVIENTSFRLWMNTSNHTLSPQVMKNQLSLFYSCLHFCSFPQQRKRKSSEISSDK